jgi:diguanylate cyclase (GGDEF)-like protein
MSSKSSEHLQDGGNRAVGPAGLAEDVGHSRAGRSVALVTLLLLAILWSFVAYWAVSTRDEVLDTTEQVLGRMDHAVEEQTRRLFKMVDVGFGIADQWVLDHPGVDPRKDPRLPQLLEGFGRRLGGVITLHLADAYGNVLMPDAGLGSPRVLGDSDFFRTALAADPGRLYIGAPIEAGVPALWKVPVAQRLSAPAGPAVVLVALIDLPTLMSLYENERIRPNGAIALIRRDGVLLVRAPLDERLLGKSYVGSQLYREFLPRRDSGFATIDRTAVDSMEKFISYSTMSDYPLLTVVSAAKDDVLASWRRQVLIIVTLAVAISLGGLFVARRLTATLAELSAHAVELHRLATTDLMTGIHNRHSFVQHLYREFARARRYRTPLALLVLDLDFFKQINDGYGHAAGDEALRAFARAAGEGLRDMDVFGRLGGEEFGVLLPSTVIEQAEVVAERIREAVTRIAIETEYGTVRFTTSIGVTECLAGDDSVDALLARADKALYAAKAAGRNRVVATNV